MSRSHRSVRQFARRFADLATKVYDRLHEASQRDETTDSLRRARRTLHEVSPGEASPRRFADTYAKTIAYALFVARLNTGADRSFRYRRAIGWIRTNSPLAHRLFSPTSDGQLDAQPHSDELKRLVQLLGDTNLEALFDGGGDASGLADPAVRFYETFLGHYDAELRGRRGVYYTPPAVVQFITDAVDQLLCEHFGCPDGVAGDISDPWAVPEAVIVDPCCGTGAFLCEILDMMRRRCLARSDTEAWRQFSREHLARRLHGIELSAPPAVAAELTLGARLPDTPPSSAGLPTIALADALASPDAFPPVAPEPGGRSAVPVVVGNPPYSNFGRRSENSRIRELLDDYKRGLGEKKLNLDDDFIKFIRRGEHHIQRAGRGILAFVTSHTYLHGLVHRRMRRHLLETFDDIYVLDLHGNSREGERAPDGGPDENVFDIQQGVAIGLFVRHRQPSSQPAAVFHAELWGQRQKKRRTLADNGIDTVDWTRLELESPYYFFCPWEGRSEEYEQYFSVTDAFRVSGSGLQTDRDRLFVDFDREALKQRIIKLLSSGRLEARFKQRYRIENTSSYPLLSRREKFEFDEECIRPFLYRAFDRRHVYYQKGLTSRPAWKVSKQMLAGDNLGLVVPRQVRDEFRHALVVDELVNRNILDTAGKFGAGRLYPLYLYDVDTASGETPKTVDDPVRRPNLTDEFLEHVGEQTGLSVLRDGTGDLAETVGPEDILAYLYALLHSPTYRARYEQQLRVDYPRLPVTPRVELFSKMANVGRKLIDLHLMLGDSTIESTAEYPIGGSDEVAPGFPRFVPPGEEGPEGEITDRGRVFINGGFNSRHPSQYFRGVSPEAWHRRIGGYQILHRWLADRRGRRIDDHDRRHYRRLVAVLTRTGTLMRRIDEIIDELGGWPLVHES